MCVFLHGQGGTTTSQRIVISNSLGRPLGGVAVEICTTASVTAPACAAAATIYSDPALSVPISCTGPTTCLTTDSLGRVPTFFASPGNYCYAVSGAYITDTSCQLIIIYVTAGTSVLLAPAGTQTITGGFALGLTGQLTSTVTTGTAPFVVSSTTPVVNLSTSPIAYDSGGGQFTNAHIVAASIALSSGTPSTATVTLTGAAPFSNSGSYRCALSNETSQANPVKYARSSGSAFVITGPNTVLDTVSFICVGN